MAEKVLRFAISDGSGLRAATWRLWTPSRKADIYLTCRTLGGALKASMHESGSWHLAYTQETFEQRVDGTSPTQTDRFIERWLRPAPIRGGITLAYRIITPYSAVTSPIRQTDRKIIWIPNCRAPFATEIDIFIISSESPVTGWPGKNQMNTQPIGAYNIPTGESVWAVYRMVDMPDLSKLGTHSGRFYKGRGRDDLKSDSLRVLAFGETIDGSRVIYDCAVTKKSG